MKAMEEMIWALRLDGVIDLADSNLGVDTWAGFIEQHTEKDHVVKILEGAGLSTYGGLIPCLKRLYKYVKEE